jgi:N-acetylmuramoyl-L-alanine amidase
MYRRWWRAAAVLFLVPGIAAPNSGEIQVTGIHFWTHPDSTRFIIDTSGPFEVRAERVFNPDRIYFDLQHARPWIAGHRNATEVVDDKLISRVRIAETTPGTTRIVFDLKIPANFRMSRLESPDRMVIDIEAMHSDTLSVSSAPVVSPPPLAYIPPARLPYIPPAQADTRSARAPARGASAAFVYPSGYGQVPHFRTPVIWTYAPALPIPIAPPPPYLPDPALQIAMAKSPKPLSTALPAPVPAVSPNAALNVSNVSPTPSPKVMPATRAPLPYNAPSRPSDNASRSLTRALGLKVNRIVIDAGHGGHDDGTIGPNGVLEKDVVLDVALRLARLVQAKMGAEVVLTRSDDTFIPLQQRTAIANDHKADLFLSIHANSSPSPGVAGTETFFLNFTNSSAALDVAARENAGSDKSVGELKDLIQSITLNDKIAESETFAQQIENSIFAQAAKSNTVARNRGVKRAPFVVLIGASMPSVLAEIGFLSNTRDESNLAKPEYRQKIAESLLKGLSQYAQSLSHFEMTAAKTSALN